MKINYAFGQILGEGEQPFAPTEGNKQCNNQGWKVVISGDRLANCERSHTSSSDKQVKSNQNF